MAKAFLGLGSNLGDKRANLEEALKKLKNHPRIEILKVSSFYETEPVGFIEQDWFLNIAVKIDTSLTPLELLEFCQSIERDLLRKREIRWGPRTIDLDILLYENFTSQSEKLTIPHPRMKERAFVLVPLEEIEPDLVLDGLKISQILAKLNGEKVKKVE
ncbi:MAG: 2-amino-4-hydroxy-6-hydroxymethyldihydropteridine diphosphokinase [Clostridia bacterium]|nr:2-amino-4-hydroxy-6-hydroxymethyldihydropteridine diphosphokinase [Clostridia bacterium]